jgi:hypothetical protein
VLAVDLIADHPRRKVAAFLAGGQDRVVDTALVAMVETGRVPAVLVGENNGPTGAEYVLLAPRVAGPPAWSTSPPPAAAPSPRSDRPTGGIELNGILGLDGNVRNGYQNMTVTFTAKGDARRRSRGLS